MYNPMLLKVWLACQISGGLVGVPILLATLYISDLKRLKTLYNLLLTWIFSAVVSSLLFFVDQAMPSDPPPEYTLCLMQAAMIYGVPPLTALSALALIYDSWIVITGHASSPKDPVTIRRNMILVSIPWMGWLVTAMASLFVGVFDGTHLGRDRRFFYCSFKNDHLTNTIAILTGLIVLAAATITSVTVWKLYMYWHDIKKMCDDPSTAENMMGSSYVILRIGIFGFNLFLSLALSFISIPSPKSPIPDLFAGTMSVSVFLIFGTQQDIILVWVSGLRWIYNWVLGRHRPPTRPEGGLSSSRDDDGVQREDRPATVSISNTFTVWKDKYLDKTIPPTAMWLERKEEAIEDDFEGFWRRGSRPAERKEKPLPQLPMSQSLPPGLA